MIKHAAGWRVWAATHDNGWRAWVADRSDGIYVAGILGPQPVRETRSFEDFDRARAEALSLLRQHTNHKCGPTCSMWAQTLSNVTRG